ncbi:hypothetical protein [Nannocystis pusilla]|uniref:hypothetical protein n=1 Tax=Nannocystis pusilla TaxID=889268 RepID=UPI003BEFEAE5
MPTLNLARILVGASLLACGPTSDETTAATTTTGDTASTTAATHEPDPSTGTTTDGTTTAPTTGSTVASTATTDHAETGTTTSPGPVCGAGWCAAKELLNVQIHDNHEPPHELEIPAVDVAACEARTYEFTGLADHTHAVTLTPEHIATIDQGGSIEIESSEAQGHTHTVWSDCE